MTALAIPAMARDASTFSTTTSTSTSDLLRDVIALHGTAMPARQHMLDALHLRGMGRLARVLEHRNRGLSAVSRIVG